MKTIWPRMWAHIPRTVWIDWHLHPVAGVMGTAGELSGDTPLAQAVLDLANAVNNVSAAHQHAGAVDALDEVIRRIQQQGTTGLVDDLIAEASEEATQAPSNTPMARASSPPQ